MKLSTIKDQYNVVNKLNFVCGTYICESHEQKQFVNLFIESVVQRGLLSEDDTNALTTLFRAGIAKIQAALSPETDHDLDSLLLFMARRGGGVKRVNKLIAAAKASNESIIDDTKWWDSLFKSFGIVDGDIRNKIYRQVATNIKQSTPQAPQTQAPQTTPKPKTKASPGSWMNQLTQERDRVLSHQQQLMGLLAKSQAMRSDTNNRLEALSKRLEELRNQQATEAFVVDCAAVLLEFQQVRDNLPTIIRSIAPSSVIVEAGLFDRTKHAFQAVPGFLRNLTRHAGEISANPQYAKSKYQNIAQNYTNERAAKLAVRILTDHLQQKFAATLQNANATPQQIIQDLGKFQGYQSRIQAGGGQQSVLAPNELSEYQALRNKLTRIYRLFNSEPATPATTATPDAPPVVTSPSEQIAPLQPQGQPIDAEAIKEPASQSPADRLISMLGDGGFIGPGAIDVLTQAVRKNPQLQPPKILDVLQKKGAITPAQAKNLLQRMSAKPRNRVAATVEPATPTAPAAQDNAKRLATAVEYWKKTPTGDMDPTPIYDYLKTMIDNPGSTQAKEAKMRVGLGQNVRGHMVDKWASWVANYITAATPVQPQQSPTQRLVGILTAGAQSYNLEPEDIDVLTKAANNPKYTPGKILNMLVKHGYIDANTARELAKTVVVPRAKSTATV